MRHGEPQDAGHQLVAQPAQQPLAELALERIDVLLEPAVDQDRDQEQQAEPEQVAELLDLEPAEVRDVHGEGDALALDALVHDVLGQVERDVIEELRRGHEAADRQRVLDRKPDHVPEDRPVESFILP